MCKRGITPVGYYLLKVRIQHNSLLGTLPTIKVFEIEVIMLPTQHPVRMAFFDFQFGSNSKPRENSLIDDEL